MKTEVGIAELKANLSKYLRAAQRGREFIVKDRDTPIVRISAFEKNDRLISRLPTASMLDAHKLFEEFHAKHPELADIKDEDIEEAFRSARMDWSKREQL